MTNRLKSFLSGSWQEGGDTRPLVNPTTGEVLAEAGSAGLDLGAALEHGRTVGGATLRGLGFAERGRVLAAMASALHARRDELIEIAIRNGGNTRGDAKFDIDGATGTLSAYARMAEALGERRFLLDGDEERLGRSPRWVGRHILTPRRGVAVHINAFNFPAWGLFEKAAVSLLAGVPVLSKPATATALLAARAVEILHEASVLPEGSLQLLVGGAGDLLDHLEEQDLVAFTGSADTGRRLRGHANVLARSVPVAVEADSLNAAVLGPDVEPGSDTWDLFLRDVAREVTQKAGQKCTAIRRVIVPTERVEAVTEELSAELGATVFGDPSAKGVRMGPVNDATQLQDVLDGIEALRQSGCTVVRGAERGAPQGVAADEGYFVSPTLLAHADPATADAVHDREVFGPVATVLTYDGTASSAADIVARGRGSLVSSAYSDDVDFAGELIVDMAPHLGRVYLGSARVAEHTIGSGAVLPQLVHGGPGRAGGGEELGGLRGLSFYMQRTAIQGEKTLLEKILGPDEGAL